MGKLVIYTQIPSELPRECSKSKRRRESVTKEENVEAVAESLGMQKCSGKFLEGPGTTYSLVSRALKAQELEEPQMLAPNLSLCGLCWALEIPPRPSSLSSAGLRVQNFPPHLVSAMGPRNQMKGFDYYEGIRYYIFEPTTLLSDNRGWLGGGITGERRGQANGGQVHDLVTWPIPILRTCWQWWEDPHLLLGDWPGCWREDHIPG